MGCVAVVATLPRAPLPAETASAPWCSSAGQPARPLPPARRSANGPSVAHAVVRLSMCLMCCLDQLIPSLGAMAGEAVGGNGGRVAEGSGSSKRLACLVRAETEIAHAPDREGLCVTTSRAFKRDLASFFCARGADRLVAVELGVFHGHTTAVLAAMFSQVLAVDVEPSYLQVAAAKCAQWRNVFYMAFDTYADPWRILAAHRVDVVIIDADHKYEKVRSDTHNVLQHLPSARWLVFDDYGVEEDVRLVVHELLEVEALRWCWPMGRGKFGGGWYFDNFGQVNHSEGLLCMRGNSSRIEDAKAAYVSVTFLLYAVPAEQLIRAESVMSFKPDGMVFTSHFGEGAWQAPEETPTVDLREPAHPDTNRDFLSVVMPHLPPLESSGYWEALFNKGRSAFVLTPQGSTTTRWFGIRADRVAQVFRIASESFD